MSSKALLINATKRTPVQLIYRTNDLGPSVIAFKKTIDDFGILDTKFEPEKGKVGKLISNHRDIIAIQLKNHFDKTSYD